MIAGWAGAGNTGDELLTSWAVSEVRSAGGTPIVLSVDPVDTSQRHGVESVKAFSHRAVGAIVSADGLVVGPGGILQDSTSIWSLPAHCARPMLAKLTRTPIVASGVGVGPIRRRGSGTMLRLALSGAEAIVVRDERSAAIVRRFCLPADTAPDAVFAYAPQLLADHTARPDRIVVSLRMTEVGGTFKPNRASEVRPDINAWAVALTELRRRIGAPIRFVSFDPGRDEELHSGLADRIGDCETVAADNLNAPAEIARSLVTVAGRYHAAVLSVAAGRPLVAVDQGTKLPALVEQVGSGAASTGPLVSAESVCCAAEEAIAGSVELSSTSARLATRALAHGTAIRGLVESVIGA